MPFVSLGFALREPYLAFQAVRGFLTGQSWLSFVLMSEKANFKKKAKLKKDEFIPHRNQLYWCYAKSPFLICVALHYLYAK